MQLSTNSHLWDIDWKPHIEIFPRQPPCIYTIWPTRGEKLQQLHRYHPFSDSRDTYLTKNHYENYSPKMVPTNPTGSWTKGFLSWLSRKALCDRAFMLESICRFDIWLVPLQCHRQSPILTAMLLFRNPWARGFGTLWEIKSSHFILYWNN